MNFKYCPKCGQQGAVNQENASKYTCSNCGWEFWNNPAATVSAVFIRDGQALFAKRAIEPNKGKYDFPGGFVDYNEDIYEACVREIDEEMGIRVNKEDLQLITGYTRIYVPGQSVVDLIIVVKAWPEGDFTPQDDVAALEWKPIDFVKDEEFAPKEYVGLDEKLKKLNQPNS